MGFRLILSRKGDAVTQVTPSNPWHFWLVVLTGPKVLT